MRMLKIGTLINNTLQTLMQKQRLLQKDKEILWLPLDQLEHKLLLMERKDHP